MINFLPNPQKRSIPLPTLRKFLRSKRGKYLLAIFCDLILIAAIIFLGRQPITGLISPLTSSWQALNYLSGVNHKTTSKVFSFAPGLAQNKFSQIDFNGLSTLAFFDVPIDPETGIITDSREYNSFRSDEAAQLFETAHFNKTKVLLTLTLPGNDAITEFLDSLDSQKKILEQITTEIDEVGIDGVVINLATTGNLPSRYQDKFAQFTQKLTNYLHSHRSDLQVAVVVPDSTSKKSNIFNLQALAESTDQILMMADDFAVPESKNNSLITPIFGPSGNDDYWNQISQALNAFMKSVPSEKLSLERAWYGNGDRYPLYVPNEKPPQEASLQPAHVSLDQETIDQLVSSVPDKARAAAQANIPLIGKALEDEGILDSNVLAYALATVEHETADTFEPLEEFSGRLSAKRLGYEGGTNYFGRGFIQLTHLRNYQAMGKRIGMGDELVKHPELASTPEVAAKILAAFFKDNNIANLASQGNFVAARVPINPDQNGYAVALLAWKYELN